MKPHPLSCLLGLFSIVISHAQLPVVNGWTQFSPSSDSRIIYVSDTDGNDATAINYSIADAEIGVDPFLPTGTILAYKTLNAAKAQVRSGFADWVLLKKGDTFSNQQIGLVNWQGKNALEPLFIGSYGSASSRPQVLTGAGNFISFTGNAAFVSIVGIYAEPHTRSGSDEPVGIEILNAPFRSFLVEDCYLNQYFIQIVVQDYSGITPFSHSGITIRRSILTNGYKISGGGGGLFFHGIDSILVEENLIDHNGWSETIAGANANGFSHNTYFHPSCGLLTFRNNIVSRASAVGIGARCGGQIFNNLLLENPRNIFMGTFDQSQINYPTEFATGEIAYNVVLGARVEPTYDPGNGITVDRVKNAQVHHNIVAHFTQTSDYNLGLGMNNIENLTIKKNIVYNWGNNLNSGPAFAVALNIGNVHTAPVLIDSNDFQLKNTQAHCAVIAGAMSNFTLSRNRYFNVVAATNWFGSGDFAAWNSATNETNAQALEVNYTDPNRSIVSYLATLGITGDLDDFITARKNMNKSNWNADFTAEIVNDYIREGFDMQKLTPTIGTNNFTSSPFSYFPNPVIHGWLTIQISNPTNYAIYHLDGRMLQEGVLQDKTQTISINTINSGIYILKVGQQAVKLIIQ